MKKFFTILFLFVLILSTYGQQQQKVKVIYFGKDKTMDTSAGQDPLLTLLKNDSRLDVTDYRNYSDTTGSNLFSHDVVVLSEALGSGDGAVIQLLDIIKTEGKIKPFLNMKLYAYKSTTWNFGTPADANTTKLKVLPNKSNHPIFNQVTISNNIIEVFKRLANDAGAAGTKGINYAHSLTANVPQTFETIAQPNDDGKTIENDAVSIHISNDNKYIGIGFNYGAMCADNATNLTNDGLQILKNAIDILVTPFLTKIKENSTNEIKAFALNGEIKIFVDNPTIVSIYSYEGRLIQKVPVQNYTSILVKPGLYIVNIAGIGSKKIVVE